jgi:nitric oxide reductase NorD protein
MDYRELRRSFHEQIFPSRPNEWDIEEALDDLEDLTEEQQQILLQAIPTVWPISHSLSFSFLKEGARNAPELDQQRLEEWLRRILHNYEEGGLKKARAYMATSDLAHLHDQGDEHLVFLEDKLARLTSYAGGISGLDIRLQSGAAIYTDTETIYLPAKADIFRSSNENLLFYKLLISLQSRFILQGSFSPFRFNGPSPKNDPSSVQLSDIKRYFGRFAKELVAKDLYQLLEIDQAMSALRHELPGLIRETGTIRKALCHLHQQHCDERKSPLTELLLGIMGDDQFQKIEGKETLVDLLPNRQRFDQPSDLLQEMYDKVSGDCDNCEEFSFSPFMDRFNFEEADAVTAQRVQRNKNTFTTVLADFLRQKENVAEEKMEIPIAGEKGDIARIVKVTENDPETAAGISASIVIDNTPIELPEEIRNLISSIQADLGTLPDAYVAAAFGLAGRGRTAGHGKESATVVSSTERFIPYDEWDYRRHGYRRNWCSLRQRRIEGITSDFVERTLTKHRGSLIKIRRQFEMMRTQERFARRRRHGDDIDLDALIDSLGDQHAGLPPSEKLFVRLIRNERSISTIFLVDMSNSTEGWIGIAIKEALVLFCEALEVVGDNYGIYGFSGMRRMRSEVYQIKDIEERYSRGVKERIAAISPKEYTRMGPPIRHMTNHLAGLASKTRLLLILSDGKPEDYDDYKGTYAIEDTRKALAEARGQGIFSYCITIDQESHDYLEYLFGRGNYSFVKNIEQLPSRLTDIYRLLTR